MGTKKVSLRFRLMQLAVDAMKIILFLALVVVLQLKLSMASLDGAESIHERGIPAVLVLSAETNPVAGGHHHGIVEPRGTVEDSTVSRGVRKTTR